ncbi:MAG: MlaD family protein [Ignavibacteria bacterium]|nr:MlaD family protein [Ignavibacteria bacterium]
MGINNSKYIKLGIFIVTGLTLFVVALFYIGSKDNLFTKTIDIYANFANVSGLAKGNSVQFAGINVGTVQSIDIIASDKVRVNMNIISDVKQFIKKDSEASINSDGLVGNKVLSISSGSVSSATVESGDSIHSVKPITIGDIVSNLNESTKDAQLITKSLADILGKVNNGEGTIGKLINNSDIFDELDSLMNSFSGSTANINKILFQTSNVIGLVTDDIEKLQGSIDTIVMNISGITTKINSGQSLIGTLLTDTVFANNIKGVMTNANQTTANLELGSFSFYQNMEALKHNFLFKGYFEDLGYWDKSAYDKTMQSRETRILNKENDLTQREAKLREFQLKLDSLRNILEDKSDSLKLK